MLDQFLEAWTDSDAKALSRRESVVPADVTTEKAEEKSDATKEQGMCRFLRCGHAVRVCSVFCWLQGK